MRARRKLRARSQARQIFMAAMHSPRGRSAPPASAPLAPSYAPQRRAVCVQTEPDAKASFLKHTFFFDSALTGALTAGHVAAWLDFAADSPAAAAAEPLLTHAVLESARKRADAAAWRWQVSLHVWVENAASEGSFRVAIVPLAAAERVPDHVTSGGWFRAGSALRARIRATVGSPSSRAPRCARAACAHARTTSR